MDCKKYLNINVAKPCSDANLIYIGADHKKYKLLCTAEDYPFFEYVLFISDNLISNAKEDTVTVSPYLLFNHIFRCAKNIIIFAELSKSDYLYEAIKIYKMLGKKKKNTVFITTKDLKIATNPTDYLEYSGLLRRLPSIMIEIPIAKNDRTIIPQQFRYALSILEIEIGYNPGPTIADFIMALKAQLSH